MKLSFHLFLISSFFLLAFAPHFANAASVVIGDTCSTLGTSQMTSDRQNIATCLEDSSGDLKWKGMTTSSSNSGTLCGKASATYSYTCSNTSAYDNCGGRNYSVTHYNLIQCNDSDVLSLTKNSSRITLKNECPSGYHVTAIFNGKTTREIYDSWATTSLFGVEAYCTPD